MKKNLENGFVDHGVATPVSNHRGTVATVDGQGRKVVLVWLFDHRGGYALLMIDAETGQTREIPVPFPTGGDCPYASILSSRNRFYTHFNSHFIEFDPATATFTFCHTTAPQMAMGMTEDDQGVIWSVTYPDSGVVSFNPTIRDFRDYGHVHHENWRQYQRFVAADDAGWIYFGLGNTAGQIVAFEPATGKAVSLLADAERGIGTALVYRDLNGKVYGQPLQGQDDNWYELYRGKATRIGAHSTRQPKPIITSSQGLFHARFPDGKQLIACNLLDHQLVVEDPATGKRYERTFTYSSDGAHIMGVAASPDGTVCGGTAFPMRAFQYNPGTDTWINHEGFGQFNTLARQGDRMFVGGYIRGFLLEWDPATAWGRTEKGVADSNPRFLTECEPSINRPHKLLACPDGNTVILAGTPGYGYTGGGLLFWDRRKQAGTLVEHTDLLPDHSTMSLAPLPGNKVLGGGTTDPGTGGERKAAESELFILDITSRRIEWHDVVLRNVQGYSDLCTGRDGLVYGMADAARFFVFDPDPVRRVLLHEENLEPKFGLLGYQQGQRKMLMAPDGTIYVLFLKGIARVNTNPFTLTWMVDSPVPIHAGGDILDGRIYFASASHLYSFMIPGARTS